MATMNKNVPFKDGDNLDLYLSAANECTVQSGTITVSKKRSCFYG